MAALITLFRRTAGGTGVGLSVPGLRRRARLGLAEAPWLPTALGMALLLVVYGSWQVFRWTPSGDQRLTGDAFFYPVGLVAAWMAWRASQRSRGSRRLQAAWRFLALAASVYLLGDIAQTVYEATGKSEYPSWADPCYLAFYPLTLAGVLCFPAARRSRVERVRMALDMAVVAIGGTALVGYVLLGPIIAAAGGSPVLQTVVSIAYPVGDVILFLGLATLLRQSIPSAKGALRLLTVGLLFFVAGDLVCGYMTLHGSYQGGDPVDTLWIVAVACLAVAAAAQAPLEAAAQVAPNRNIDRVAWLPYGAVAAAFVVLLISERSEAVFPVITLTLGALALTLVVAARQFLAQHDLVGAQDELRHQAMHDTLTGLPNRALVLDRAEQVLARARRQHSPVAALYVDVDGFKHVNDTLGHAAGDTLLETVAARLSSVMRASDTVGRLSGDEFICLLDSPDLDASPELVAARILEVLRVPIDLHDPGKQPLTITASIGIARGERDEADDLLRDADIALYQAKEAGRDCYRVFESSMHTVAHDRATLEMDLNDALEKGQFFLLYQPTLDLELELMTGVEALLRWRHPTRGLLLPDLFIPIAERNGTIVPIGRWVLDEACAQAAAWHGQGHELGMAVNVSARQLESDTFVEEARAALDRSGLEPSALTLEITETTLMRDPDSATRRLAALKTLGVRLAIDDFGAGYSSLAYLRQFPVDAIKIDRSFVSGLTGAAGSAALIHTLVQLGRTLGLQTLGEGIEQPVQLETLQREQCDLGQGFLFARPLTAEAIHKSLEHDRDRRAGMPHAQATAPGRPLAAQASQGERPQREGD